MNKYFILAYPLISIQFQNGAFCQTQQTYFDSLTKKIALTISDTEKIKLLDRVSFAYSRFDCDKSIRYALSADSLATKLNLKKYMANANLDLGLAYDCKSDHSSAAKYYALALKAYKEISDKRGESSVYVNRALMEKAGGNYAQAIKDDFNALSILEGLEDTAMKAVVLENIGTIYLEQKMFRRALKYYQLSFEGYQKAGDKRGMSRNLANQGIILSTKGEYQQALTQHLQALKVNEETGDEIAIQINLANIGITYLQLKKYDQALRYHLRALALCRKLGDGRNTAISLGNTGELYYYMAADPALVTKRNENISKAVEYLTRGIEACEAIKFEGPLVEFKKFLADVYELSGDYKMALAIFKDYKILEDSVFSHESTLVLAGLEKSREAEIHRKNILLKDREIEIQRLGLANKRKEKTIFLIAIAILTTILFWLGRMLYLRSKRHRRLLSDLAYSQSHEVRAPLARILGLIEVLKHENGSPESNEKIIGLINESAVELDKVIRVVISRAEKTS